jgi:hypothetical protein
VARRAPSALGPPGSALRRWRLALGAALAGLLLWLAGPFTPWRLAGETGAASEAFDEFALRAPAWLAAIASVVLVGLLRDLGFPRAGPVAAFLLALHPWHVRYGADGMAPHVRGLVAQRMTASFRACGMAREPWRSVRRAHRAASTRSLDDDMGIANATSVSPSSSPIVAWKR